MGKSYAVIGLGYGDECKGATVDWLARSKGCGLTVRFNGGCQAAHNVVAPFLGEVLHHTFSQFGSHTLATLAPTYLSPHCIVDPLALIREAEHLQETFTIANAPKLVYIDENAPVVTPYHRAVNHLRELSRREDRHGSVGLGVGEVARDLFYDEGAVLRVSDLLKRNLSRGLRLLQEYKWACAQLLLAQVGDLPHDEGYFRAVEMLHANPYDLAEQYRHALLQANICDQGILQKALAGPDAVIFEGAQGVLLDEWVGFHPYTTWSTTTAENALSLWQECGGTEPVTVIGATRSYASRHGPGPLPTEAAIDAPELHNLWGEWQGGFRTGWLDMVMLGYAVDAAHPDCLAVSHLDLVRPGWKIAFGYHFGRVPSTDYAAREKLTRWLMEGPPLSYEDLPGNADEALCAHVRGVAGRPIAIQAYGPTAADRYETEEFEL